MEMQRCDVGIVVVIVIVVTRVVVTVTVMATALIDIHDDDYTEQRFNLTDTRHEAV